MEQTMSPSTLSMPLVASLSYVLTFIPTENRSELTSWAIAPFLRHAVSRDLSHLSSFIQFIQAGGGSLLPCLDYILNELLLHQDALQYGVAKAIGMIIQQSPKSLSKCFWYWFERQIQESNGISLSLISLIGEATIYGDIFPPQSQSLINQIETFCRSHLQPSEPFHILEASLSTLLWLVRFKCIIPTGLLPIYKSSSLSSTVLDIWAEYIKYGDLSILPTFSILNMTKDPLLLASSTHLLSSAIKNPNFSFQDYTNPHWIWNSILNEFAPELLPLKSSTSSEMTDKDLEKTNTMFSNSNNNEKITNNDNEKITNNDNEKITNNNDEQITNNNDEQITNNDNEKITNNNDEKVPNNKRDNILVFDSSCSLLNLSISELDAIVQAADILPGWVFVHAMRSRKKGVDFIIRMVQLVEKTPILIIFESIRDFLDWIDFIINNCGNSPEIINAFIDCLRSQIEPLRPYHNQLLSRIISGIDYFNERSLCVRLKILNEFFYFIPDITPFLDVFDSIMEIIHLYDLSLSLLKALFSFFSAVAPHVPEHHKFLTLIAFASLIATANTNYPSMPHPNQFSQNTNHNNQNISEIPSFISENELALKILNRTKTFYSIISSDLINDPNYHIKQSFSLTEKTLTLLQKLPIYPIITQSILSMLPNVLPICPVETTSLVVHYLSLDENNDKESSLKKSPYLDIFCSKLFQTLAYNSSPSMVTVLRSLQSLLCYPPKNITKFLIGKLSALPRKRERCRLVLNVSPNLIPMVLTELNHLELLYETWAPPPTSVLLEALFESIHELPIESFQIERNCRNFLHRFHMNQPPFKRKTSWIYRDFSSLKRKTKLHHLSLQIFSSLGRPKIKKHHSQQISSQDFLKSTNDNSHIIESYDTNKINDVNKENDINKEIDVNKEKKNEVNNNNNNNNNKANDDINNSNNNETKKRWNKTLAPILPNTKLSWNQLIKEFSECFPVPKAETKGDLVVLLAKMYRKTPCCLQYLEALATKELSDSLKSGSEHLWFIKFLAERRVPFSLPEQTTNEQCLAWFYRKQKTNELKLTDKNQNWFMIEIIRKDPIANQSLLDEIQSVTLNGLFLSPKNADLQMVTKAIERNIPSVWANVLFKLSGQLKLLSHSELLVLINCFSEFLRNFDIFNPILFRSVILFVTALATCNQITQSRQLMNIISSAEDNFLINFTSKVSVNSAPVYEAFASLEAIENAIGKLTKGKVSLKKLCSEKEFESVNFLGYEPFYQIINAIAKN